MALPRDDKRRWIKQAALVIGQLPAGLPVYYVMGRTGCIQHDALSIWQLSPLIAGWGLPRAAPAAACTRLCGFTSDQLRRLGCLACLQGMLMLER